MDINETSSVNISDQITEADDVGILLSLDWFKGKSMVETTSRVFTSKIWGGFTRSPARFPFNSFWELGAISNGQYDQYNINTLLKVLEPRT